MSHATLIVGEAPGRGVIRAGTSGDRLSGYAGRPVEEWADWVNLLDEWPGYQARGKGTRWSHRAAAARVATVPFGDYDRVVLLGRRVAAAVLPAGAGLPFLRWIDHDGHRFAVVPHPSGIVRWWNDPGNAAKAAAFLAPLTAETSPLD